MSDTTPAPGRSDSRHPAGQTIQKWDRINVLVPREYHRVSDVADIDRFDRANFWLMRAMYDWIAHGHNLATVAAFSSDAGEREAAGKQLRLILHAAESLHDGMQAIIPDDPPAPNASEIIARRRV